METQDERKSQAYGNNLRPDEFNENIWEDKQGPIGKIGKKMLN